MQTVESTMIIQFDKYRFIKGLSRDNLYTAEQAERIAEELESALSPSPRMLATKDDLREVNTKLESNIEQFGTKLESDIAQVRLEISQIINKLYVAFAIGAVSIVSIILTVLPLILRQ